MLKAFCFIAPKSCLPPLPSFFLYKLFSTLVFILSSCLSFCYVFSNLLSFLFLSFCLPVCHLSSSFTLHLFFLSHFSPQFYLLLLYFNPNLSTFLPVSGSSLFYFPPCLSFSYTSILIVPLSSLSLRIISFSLLLSSCLSSFL